MSLFFSCELVKINSMHGIVHLDFFFAIKVSLFVCATTVGVCVRVNVSKRVCSGVLRGSIPGGGPYSPTKVYGGVP